MNKKLKCLLCAILTVVILGSAAIAMPATAAENDMPAQIDEAVEEAAAEDTGSDVFSDSAADLKNAAQIAVTAEEPATEAAEPADPTEPEEVEPQLDADLNPYRDGKDESRIILKWTAAPGVEGYRIYWKNADVADAAFKYLTSVADPALTVSNLKKGAKYTFDIRPYITQDGEIVEGKSTIFTGATMPAAVRNFRLTSGSSKGTVMKWTANTEKIDGYMIMRQYQGVWTKYKYLDANVTEFKDTDVIAGKAYYYKIYAFRKVSVGNVYGAGVLLRTVCGLCAPADQGTASRGNRVYFKYKKIKYATGYQIYYSSDNKTYKALLDVTSTTCTSKKFETGATMYFRIRPYRLVGTSKTRVVGTYSTVKVKIIANPYGENYIEIDIGNQHMWYFVNGEVYVSTDIVTGNKGSSDTPTGTYSVLSKARNINLVGSDYVSFVQYWIAFIGTSYGIHDASWRSSFGGSIYKSDGSHGCVNTPLAAVKKIYNKVTIGTLVVVHK